MEKYLLWSCFLLVFLTFCVWVQMYYIRITTVKKHRISVNDLSVSNIKNIPSAIITSGDNFRNLCELPILFYALIPLLIYYGFVDKYFVALAWLFVVGRVLHSIIHVSYNKISHRFSVYFISSVFLWIMWLRFLLLVI